MTDDARFAAITTLNTAITVLREGLSPIIGKASSGSGLQDPEDAGEEELLRAILSGPPTPSGVLGAEFMEDIIDATTLNLGGMSVTPLLYTLNTFFPLEEGEEGQTLFREALGNQVFGPRLVDFLRAYINLAVQKIPDGENTQLYNRDVLTTTLSDMRERLKEYGGVLEEFGLREPLRSMMDQYAQYVRGLISPGNETPPSPGR